jgi:hypothetical protein
VGDSTHTTAAPCPQITGPHLGDLGRAAEEQAVLVTLDLGAVHRADLPALADAVEGAILADGTGELDGLQERGSDVTLFAYGIDAERLWASMQAAVCGFPHRSGSVTIRYGLIGSPERCLPV